MLTSFKGGPKIVDGNVLCGGQKNGHTFTEEEIRAVCDVGGVVYV